MTDKSKWLARLSDTTTIMQVDDVTLEFSYDNYRIHAVRTWTDEPPQETKQTQGILNFLNAPTAGGIIIQDVKHFNQAIKQARAFARHNAEAVYLEYHPAQHALSIRTRSTDYGTVDASIPAQPIGAARFFQVLINARYLQDALIGLKGAVELYITDNAVFITQWGWSEIQFAAIAIMADGLKKPAPIITNEPAPVLAKPIKSNPIRLYKREKPAPQPVPDYVKTVELLVWSKKYRWGGRDRFQPVISLVGVRDGE